MAFKTHLCPQKMLSSLYILCVELPRFLRNLLFTFVYPYLIHCAEVWGNACDTHLDPIIKIQKNCVLVITFSYCLKPIESLFKDLNILALKILMILRILLLMFKHNIDIVPKFYCLIIYKKKKGKIHSYNARHCRSLHPAIRNQKQHNY